MSLKRTKLHILPKHVSMKDRAKTGVSLHCHTQLSKEMLDFVPFYASKLPIISFFWHRERDNYEARTGKRIDFSDAFWSPPLPPAHVFQAERAQIEAVDLEPIVSITDHDCIDANLEVNETSGDSSPISLEWTVPFEYGFFHVGVHNLPKEGCREITEKLLDYTFNSESQTNERLHELFALLNEDPSILVVLNHPLWDIELVGQEKHETLLSHFLIKMGTWIHALEINGFRSWSENKAVLEMAEAFDMPVVTGGDRHGCRPNTVINVTNSKTFEEFVEEVRVDKRSEVVLMPEYRLPLHSRQLQSFSEILSNYPEFVENRKRWFDRVHYNVGDGLGVRPLSVHWKHGGPQWLRMAIWTLGFLGSPSMRPLFSLARKSKDKVPSSTSKVQFEIPSFEKFENSRDAEFSSESIT
jgi:hypothetical protein